ncbi:MAG: hypothetical protein QOE24_3003 [Frankiales bacterium]|jgi:hypothetical protein|nr:hypothetical protein [Frankiales bacterium]
MRNRKLAATFMLLLALSVTACGGSSSQPTQGSSPSSGSPASASCTIPQNNGGDHDADNNGGPDDGDGCDL